MDTNSVVTRNDELMSAPVDREIVFLNPATDSYVGLDEIGRRIWELLDRPRRIGQLVDLLCDEFDGAPDVIRSDVLVFLQALEGEGMVGVDHRGTS
jgi:hypothetical protein